MTILFSTAVYGQASSQHRQMIIIPFFSYEHFSGVKSRMDNHGGRRIVHYSRITY
ncbi:MULTISPECIES: hypothetical protein [unclassified Oceanispirochaeta]|uniref:hypothetical protein n=1 Tax=unclassified Oceanispirochaeta TaxID=2635722 RepID=UPI001314AA7D|nr:MULTISPECIES: hypothetical protein [unclassified Oceanispirochaeta]MBF9015561.1 hypothetical protein [Oceanispirochaeta sp. M2]NPD73950.1 hypothetical protein [Oceanispirochaeta sp. M1]